MEGRLSVVEIQERPGESSGRDRPAPWVTAPVVPFESDQRSGTFAVRRIGTAPIILLAGLLGLVLVMLAWLCAPRTGPAAIPGLPDC